ncbi:AAA family ATPase [Microbacterium barkeri]|uniref:AAA family ATPase n=1 Tax=Microbacterium barkeri TaxID=33917 RepID=UPI0024AFC219|nr:AAA family ATPase [Microbacterium barkeri]MDI6942858.1 AAA family ATPase [Microbacterium barkeri]
MEFTARRILIAGVSGSGKSTLAARIAERTGIPHVELDDLHWGPGWQPRPTFAADVRDLAARDAWVTEWQYAGARPVLLARAQAVVWIDLPTRVTMARVIRRTIRRRIRRERLWRAGNVEPPILSALVDPDHIVRWAWRTRDKYRTGEEALPARLESRPDVTLVRLRTAREVADWLDALG